MPQLSPNVITAAKISQRSTGVPASVSLAQYALESAWGRITTGTYNYFGIKCSNPSQGTLCWTHEDYHGKWVKIQAYFQNYSSVQEAFVAHANLICNNPRYKDVMSKKDNSEAFAQALTGIYATDPDYGNKLIEIMRGSNLEQYDKS